MMNDSTNQGRPTLIVSSIIQTPPFNSSSPRHLLKINLDQTPGPGTYDITPIDKEKTYKYHSQQKKKSSVRKQFEWIFNSTRSKVICLPNNNPLIGPGSYNLQKDSSIRYPWGKCQRFSYNKNVNNSLGPGSYNTQVRQLTQKKQFGSQSVFKSTSPKIILFRAAEKLEKLERVDQDLFFPILEPEQIQGKIKIKKKHEQKRRFFSKVPRFYTEKHSNDNIGPGSYDVQLNGGLRTPQHPRLIRISKSVNTSHCAESLKDKKNTIFKTQVGPGSYNIKKFDISHDLDFKGKSFSRQTRFNFHKSKRNRAITQVPGPGNYLCEKYASSRNNQIGYQDTTKRKKINIRKSFKQSRTLNSQENFSNKQKQDSGQYKIYRQQKKKEHLDKLKLMEISLAGFNSKVPRF